MTIERLTGVLILCGLIAFVCGFHPLPTLFLTGWLIGSLIVVELRKGGYHEAVTQADIESNEAADFRQRE